MVRTRSSGIDSGAETSSVDLSSPSSVDHTPSPTFPAPRMYSRVKTGWIPTFSTATRIILHTLDLVVRVSFANVLFLLALIIKPISEPTSWELACWSAWANGLGPDCSRLMAGMQGEVLGSHATALGGGSTCWRRIDHLWRRDPQGRIGSDHQCAIFP